MHMLLHTMNETRAHNQALMKLAHFLHPDKSSQIVFIRNWNSYAGYNYHNFYTEIRQFFV